MTEFVEEFIDKVEQKIQPVPVAIMDDWTKDSPATFGVWQTYCFFTGTEAPIKILSQSNRRKRAVIICQSGFANNNVVGYISIGSQNQIVTPLAAVVAPNGGALTAGLSVVTEAESELWAAPDGSHSLTLLVLDEQYRLQ